LILALALANGEWNELELLTIRYSLFAARASDAENPVCDACPLPIRAKTAYKGDLI
jgi:hypothetical protein